MAKENQIEMEQGKIYFLSYGGNTQIVGRYKDSDACNHNFYDLLHYWNGRETFRKAMDYCCKAGITEIRRATKPEIHTLVRHEIDHDCL